MRLFIYGPQGTGKSRLREKLLAESGTRREVYTTNYHVHEGGEIMVAEHNATMVPRKGDHAWLMSKKGQIHSRRVL